MSNGLGGGFLILVSAVARHCFHSLDRGTRMKKNEFGLGILIREVKKTSLVQGFSLEWGFILKILMTRMKTDL